MTKRTFLMLLVPALLLAGCATAPAAPAGAGNQPLVGAWRSKVQFRAGAFAAVKDLEFLYAFHADGTMTESSNYDGAPPVPPAYGVWRQVAPNRYEAKYVFFLTRAPKAFDEIAGGGGWMPGGTGILTESITLGDDGGTFHSTIRLETVDETGKAGESSVADTQGLRIGF